MSQGGKEYIIVTGQSGVSIKNCLKRLGYEYIAIEDLIEDESGMQFKKYLGNIQVLHYYYWKRAFEKMFEQLTTPKKIITFHASYFHPEKRELFSPIDFELILRLKNKVKAVFVFIDDIYNVYLRLLKEGEMFFSIFKLKEKKDEKKEKRKKIEKENSLKAIYLSIFNLITLLNWREMEIATSRIIAKLLNSELFIISTNHPIKMIRRLFEKPFNELNIYYLSHHITEIRKESENYLSTFVGELGFLIKEFIKNEKNILFVPTSIDELIIKKDNNIFIPKLNPRWSEYFDPSELVRPSLPEEIKKTNPLNPLNHKLNKNEKKAISTLLNLLADKIYRHQILSRDYSLVEQSKNGIIAIRPFFNGVYSDGMDGELTHNKILLKHDKERKTFIFSCKEDFYLYVIKRTLQNFFSVDSKDFLKNCENIFQKGIDFESIIQNNNKDEFISIFSEVLPKDYDYTRFFKESHIWTSGTYIKYNQDSKERIFDKIFNDLQYMPINDKLEEGKGGYFSFNKDDFIQEVIEKFKNLNGV